MDLGNRIKTLRLERSMTQEQLAQKQMLAVMKEDWSTEGELVDHILREITRLENMKT